MAARGTRRHGGLALAALAVALVAAIAGLSPQRAEAGSCSGSLEGNAFSFSCDAPLGGNTGNYVFAVHSATVSSIAVGSPSGIQCSYPTAFVVYCAGPALAAGARVSGGYNLIGDAEPCGYEYEGFTVDAFGADYPGTEQPSRVAEFYLSCPEEEEEEEEYEWEGGRTRREGEGAEALRLGRVTLNRSRGTALLSVTVSDAGGLALGGRGVVAVEKRVRDAGGLRLRVAARGARRATLEHSGRVTVRARVRFTPRRDSAPVIKARKITLIRKR